MTMSMPQVIAWAEEAFPDADVQIAPMQYTVITLLFAAEGKVSVDRREIVSMGRDLETMKRRFVQLVKARRDRLRGDIRDMHKRIELSNLVLDPQNWFMIAADDPKNFDFKPDEPPDEPFIISGD